MLLLVNFPNESEGLDHMHLRLDSFEDARDWIEWATLYYGNAIDARIVGTRDCPRCKEPPFDLRRSGFLES